MTTSLAPGRRSGRPTRGGLFTRDAGPHPSLRTIGAAAFLLQLAVLIAWSAHLWQRYSLTSDFATFSQAWDQIGTGHLNPYETTFAYFYPHWGYPFWQSHFELLMWPLALLRTVGLSAFSLLVVQDLALAGFGFSLFRLGLDHLEEHWTERRGATVVGTGLLVALLVCPWTYWTASFDFHFQPIAACFTAMAAVDLWKGRRRGWVWIAVVLLCGDVAASYVIGLGLAALIGGRTRWRMGGALVAVGVVWILVVIALGSGKGSSLAGNYGYLAHVANGTGVAGTLAVAFGVLVHPTDVAHVLRTRLGEILKFVAAGGGLGLLSAFGLGMGVVVLLPNALNQSGVFIGAAGAFQDLVAVGFMLVGTVTLLTWVRERVRAAIVVGVLAAVAVASVLAMSVHWTPKARSAFDTVDPGTAAELAVVQRRIPSDAEVVVSQGVIGRFGARRVVYPFLDVFADGQSVPVAARDVVFVFAPRSGIELATPAQTQTAASMVADQLRATEIYRGRDVTAFLWRPGPSTRGIRFSPR